MTITMKKLAIVTALLATATLVTAKAHASENDVRFSYDASASAQETLDDLKTQARKICDRELGPLKHYGASECVNDYVGQIVKKIDRRDLTALYMGSETQTVLMTDLNVDRFKK